MPKPEPGDKMTSDRARTLLIQRALRYEGHNIEADGIWGKRTALALKSFQGDSSGFQVPNLPLIPSSTGSADRKQPPAQDSGSLDAYYGAPRENYPHLTAIRVPYPMRLSWELSQEVRKISCHERVAKPLLAALQRILGTMGIEGIKEHGLDLYGGVYNHRKIRSSSRNWSLHAYGAAIDLNPDDNGLRTPWVEGKQAEPGFATMPTVAVECFEAEGFLSGGRAWGRDAMHFQFTT